MKMKMKIRNGMDRKGKEGREKSREGRENARREEEKRTSRGEDGERKKRQ